MSFARFAFGATLLMFCMMSGAQAQECESALEDAMESFALQQYDQVIILLSQCSPQLLIENPRKIIAYEMLAIAYLSLDQADLAKQNLNKLLDLQPGYAPEAPRYSGDYLQILAEVKQERAAQAGKSSLLKNKWFWISGLAVSSAAVIWLSQKEGQPALLPEAPDPPDVRF